MFQLTWEELEAVSRSQIVTLNKMRGKNVKYVPGLYFMVNLQKCRYNYTITRRNICPEDRSLFYSFYYPS